MTEVEDWIECSGCGKATVFFVFDIGRKEIRFYVEPHLSESEVRHPNLRLKRVPNKDDPNKYDVLLSCPVCGKQTMRYFGIPLNWNVLDTPGPLVTIPFEELEPFTVAHFKGLEA